MPKQVTKQEISRISSITSLENCPNWESIVQEYTKLDIKYKRDRLPKIAGIARKYQSVVGFSPGSYVAGLWRPNIESQLLWNSENRDETRDEDVASSTCAPSWSWVSASSAVTFLWSNSRPGMFSRLFVSLLHVYGIPTGNEAFGVIEAATLELGIMCIMRLTDGQYIPATFSDCNRQKLSVSLPSLDTGDLTVWSISISWDFGTHSSRSEAFLLPILLIRGWINGLVLEKHGAIRGQYRKLGTFGMPGIEKDQKGKVISEIMWPPTYQEDCLRVLEGEVDLKYVITLV